MRSITQEGLDLICRFEGFSAKSYICPAGYPTIGYGHVVKDNEKAGFAGGITKDEAMKLLRQDVNIAEQGVLRFISVVLSNNQFSALVSFTYNLGTGALQRSTLRQKVNREEHSEVPAEFEKWVLGGGKRLPGLIKRRHAEAVMYATPDSGMKVVESTTDSAELLGIY